eukprot:NODE_284_length_2007_cov_134.879469_g195_i0.p1 GENE.NODE_284_length_2007_cov_134.879469_g195_i0~~NODE_284_length_2007_cov_134.879469_g195_i0.p1  ORF type:complete len:302 (-),score=27.36 NODE_284_length_2007_cov_134.879469_g195_i0:1072-1977(-)
MGGESAWANSVDTLGIMVAVAVQVCPRSPGRLGSFNLKKTTVVIAKKEKRPEPLRTRCEQSLLYKILSGEIPNPRAAAIGYLDDTLLSQSSALTADLVKDCYMEGVPLVANLLKTDMGSIATVIIPRFQSEIFADHAGLISDLVDAFRLCKAIGVETVSLTGLIPSATNYGQDLLAALPEGLPTPTTGHATTTACMALTIQRVLKEAGRRLSDEKVAFLGVGSIGLATLRLMLKVLPHPKQITLCDLYTKQATLDSIAEECRGELGFKGVIRVATSQSQVGYPLAFSFLFPRHHRKFMTTH